MLEKLAELNSDKPIPQDNYLLDKILGLQLLIEPQIDPRTDLKAQYACDVETCKDIDDLEAWQLWQNITTDGKDFKTMLETSRWLSFSKYRRHPHADNIIAYHKCSGRDKKRWQVHKGGYEWENDENPTWQTHWQYRLKPETITINGKEYAAPLRVAPELGAECFYYYKTYSVGSLTWCGSGNNSFYYHQIYRVGSLTWRGSSNDIEKLDNHIVFANKQDCQAVADAFNAILRGDDND